MPMSNIIHHQVIQKKKQTKKQYTINTKIQMDMVDYQAATHV